MPVSKALPLPPVPPIGHDHLPCPCRRSGTLVPIYLTDAFGCDRCPQMFVLNEQNCLVEQITAGYPSARIWQWTGRTWKMMPLAPATRLYRLLALVTLLLLGWFLGGRYLTGTASWLYWIVGICLITLLSQHSSRR